MAYTGPAITGIDVSNPGSTRSSPGINIQRLPGNNRSRDANLLLDPNNPSRALNEGAQKSQQIENFMSFFNKSVTPFLIKEQDRRARQEAGEAIDAYPSILTAAQDDPEAMDRLNALYEELMWEHDLELEFKADYKNNRIIIKPYGTP